MKKLLMLFFSTMLILSFTCIAGATTYYTFQSTDDPDLDDLDHHYYYTWGFTDQDMIDSLGSYTVITDITIEFENIRNWSEEESRLFVWLLDGIEEGISKNRDDGGNIEYGAELYDDFLDSDNRHDPITGQWLITYETPDNYTELPDIPYGYSNGATITYSFNQDQIDLFSDYLAGDTIGLGFDPDCHYYNDGISLKVTVPEPANMLLFGTGLIGLAGIGRRKFFKKS